MKFGKIVDFLHELSDLVFQDIRKNAELKIGDAVKAGEAAAKKLSDPALPYGYIADEVRTIAKNLDALAPEDVTIYFLEDAAFHLETVLFAADMDILRATLTSCMSICYDTKEHTHLKLKTHREKRSPMLRFIITATFVVLFLILSMPLMLIEWIIGKFNPGLKDRSSLAIVNWAFRMVARLSGVKQTIIGEERVPKDEPVLYIGNHQSYFDIVLTYVRVPRPTGYVAKKGMLRVPLLNVWMIFLKCQFLDRDNIKEGLKTILACIDAVKSGTSICIFPEGTRNHTPDTFMEFHEGSFKIAQKSGCAIVPISINNTAEIFENHFPKLKKTHVVIEYGEPFYIKDLPKEQQRAVGAYTSALIHSMYEKNKELV